MHPPPTTRPLARRWFALGLLALCTLHLDAAAPTNANERPRDGTDWTLADLKLTLLWIKPGTFTMGSPADERDRHKAEGPRMQVTLTRGFWLGRTEVTQAQYAAIAGENPSHFTGAGANAPAEHVSWLDATEFCRKLTAREQAAGRLFARGEF
ncbi:MAG: SUMF1/EgtB/PvdO family nonheme iron enzyme, partial [Verrucomicrobiota bacterium]